MFSKSLALPVLLALCVVGLRSTRADDNGGRRDLLPKNARWRTLPPDVKRVVIGPKGRAWFEIDGRVAPDEFMRQVQKAATLTAPWIKGARIMHLDRAGRIWLRQYGYQQWKTLLGYDPKTNKWIHRDVVPVAARAGHDETKPDSGQVVFTDSVYESKTGRLYFTDRLGVHVFDEGKWSYQHLYKENIRLDIYYDSIKSFDLPKFTETKDGRVLVWTPWGRFGWSGTLGYFVHDGKRWSHRHEDILGLKKGSRLYRNARDKLLNLHCLNGVIPTNDKRVILCTASGFALHRPLDEPKSTPDLAKLVAKDVALLADEDFEVREEAHKRLASHGPNILEHLRTALRSASDPEVIARLRKLIARFDEKNAGPLVRGHQLQGARLFGTDASGRAWIWSNSWRSREGQVTRSELQWIMPDGDVRSVPSKLAKWYPDSFYVDRKKRVYLARYGEGCVVFDGTKVTPITGIHQTSYRYVLGVDKDDRVYLFDERNVHVYKANAPDVRLGLPTTIYSVSRNEQDVVVDSEGRLWAMRHKDDDKSKSVLSYWSKGRWHDADTPESLAKEWEFIYFMPLKKGGLVAQSSSARRAYYFDGKSWYDYANLKALVEAKSSELAERIDNKRWGREYYCKLRVDGKGRIWLVEWMKAGVWDGKRWIDLIEPINASLRGPKFQMFYFLIPLPGTNSMIATSGIGNRSVRITLEGTKVKVEPFTIPAHRGLSRDYTTTTGLWFDSRDRLWLPDSVKQCRLFDKGKLTRVRETGYPRLEDSRGRIWFYDPARREVTVMDDPERTAWLTHPALSSSTPLLAEDSGGTVWATTERGLLAFQVKETDGKLRLTVRGLYDKDTPRGMCHFLHIDKEDNLWFYGPGPKIAYRLYRVQLPVAKAK